MINHVIFGCPTQLSNLWPRHCVLYGHELNNVDVAQHMVCHPGSQDSCAARMPLGRVCRGHERRLESVDVVAAIQTSNRTTIVATAHIVEQLHQSTAGGNLKESAASQRGEHARSGGADHAHIQTARPADKQTTERARCVSSP